MNLITSLPQAITDAADDTQVMKMWLSGKRSSTQQIYVRAASQFLAFVNKPLVKVMLEDLTLWLEFLTLKGYSQNSVALKISVVKSFFSYAWKIGYLTVNVSKAVVTPSTTSALHERILEQSEIKQLIAAAKSDRNRLLLTLIYTTGLRVSEALGIDWKDVKPRKKGGQVTVRGKGGKVRTVLVSEVLWQQLQALPRQQGTEAVFVSKFGNRLDRHQLHRIIKDAAERAGINHHISTHWLRHAHACHSLENGCDIDVLMRSLGHSSLTVTSKYLHARPEEGSSQFIDFD